MVDKGLRLLEGVLVYDLKRRIKNIYFNRLWASANSIHCNKMAFLPVTTY